MLRPEYNGQIANLIRNVDVELFLNEISAWEAEELEEVVQLTIDTVLDIFFEACEYEEWT